MPNRGDLARALDELERIQRELGRIGGRTDGRRAQDLIDGRRALIRQQAEVARIGETVFDADADLTREFRNRMAAMRHAAAHLQASWPAVRVRDDASGDYVRAVATVRATDTECLTWIRARIGRLEERRDG